MSARKLKWPYWLIAGIGIIVALWYTSNNRLSLLGRLTQEPTEPVVTAVEVPPPIRKPLYPVEQPAAPALQVDVAPLPPLGESDGYARTELSELFGAGINDMLVAQEIIFKFVATTDSLSAPQTPQKIWPLNVNIGTFKVVATDGRNVDEFYPSPENYQRYDDLVGIATSANAETIAAVYRQMYPLLQETYLGLGYPDGYFNDRLIEIIDLMLSTPEPAEPVVLVRPHVLYEYADPNLERLSGGQKLLLRMGTANAAKLKQALQTFRQQIVQPASPTPRAGWPRAARRTAAAPPAPRHFLPTESGGSVHPPPGHSRQWPYPR